MIRRAVFALMLVGAAFAGGAAINGPGLAWLKKTFAGGPTIIVDGTPPPSSATKKPPKQFPTAKSTPLQIDPPRDPSSRRKKAASAVDLAQNDPVLLPESPSTPASALAPLPEPDPDPLARPPAPAPVAIAQFPPSRPRTGPSPASLPPLDPGPSPKTDPVARLASVDRPEPPAENPATLPASTSVPAKDWGELRKRMKTLGVTRYTIDGETDGRVRFSCVIPVEGLRAIGHHFEAEGDDEYEAVEAALKRIALWRATAQD